MPPSGYSCKQSKYIKYFLLSISDDLKQEGLALGLKPTEALQKEIENIQTILDDATKSAVARPVLELTKLFYCEIIVRLPSSYRAFELVKRDVARQFEIEVLDIHVPS